MKYALITTLLANAAIVVSASAAWQRVGGLDKVPVDYASASITGTSIGLSKAIGQPENLLSDDVAMSSKVGTGASEVVISLGKQVRIETIYFVNDGSEGRVSAASSPDQHSWTPLSQSVYTAADRSINLKFAGAQAKYVKLQWDLSKGGAVRNLAISGSGSDKDYTVNEDPSSSQSVNTASGLGGTRVIYINPTPVRGDEIGTKYGHFEFPESPDKFRTVIYDLGRERTLTEVGSVHSPRPVRFLAYAFEKDLPETTDWRGRRSFDPSVFDSMKPVATVDDPRGIGYVKARLDKSVHARYIALRWEPDFNPPAFVVNSVTVSFHGTATPNNHDGGGGGGGGGSDGTNSDDQTGSNEKPVQGEGGQNGFMTPFSNPFSIGTAGYAGSPGLPAAGGAVAGDVSQ